MNAAGELLVSAQWRHGLTQSQLAARVRTSQAAISRIERGLASPSVSTLAHLLDLMGERLLLDTERIDYGQDRSLLQQNLERTVDERIGHGVAFSNFVRRNRGGASGRRVQPKPLAIARNLDRKQFHVRHALWCARHPRGRDGRPSDES